MRKQSVFRKVGLLTIGLASFVLLFGFVGSAGAVVCQDWETGAWNRDPSCDQGLTFEDPGVAGLALCEYRIVSITGFTFEETKGWTSAGSCSGSTWTSSPITIYINTNDPATGQPNCKYEGGFQCVVYQRAQDNFGNKSLNYDGDGTAGPAYKIDYSPPFGGSISYTNGYITSTSVALTTDDGADTASGINTASRIIQRRSAILSDGVCGSYGAFGAITPTGAYPNFTNSGLTSGNCYQYRYLVSDNAGHQTTYTSLSEVKVDAQFPRLNAFSADRATLNIANPTVVISFSPPAPEDFGGSGIQQVELWRKIPGGSWALRGDPDTPPLGTSFSDTPTDGDGTYEYGIHIVDNAQNCITEGANNCATGTPPGDGVTRTAFSPIQVQVDKTAPQVSVGGAPGSWQNSNATALVVCSDADCDVATHKIQTHTSSGTCSTTYSDYTLSSPQTISSHLWVCAAAKDNAGNAGFSLTRVEFKVEKNAPSVSAFDVVPDPPAWVSIGIPNAQVSWTVSDTGGSHLKETEVWLASFVSGSCDDATKAGCAWGPTGVVVSAPTDSDGPWSSSAPHSPGNGVWWYGMHVVDKAGNWTPEPAPQKVQVDKVAPPKPTCSPPGGTFQNRANNVTCSDTESGVTIRYTLDGSSPAGSSTLYAGPFDITSSATLTVAAWDEANNRSDTPDNSYVFTILHNQAPTIQGNPSDSPDPIKGNAQITFTVNWTDPDSGDLTRTHICKTNSISGQTCSGGSWCDSANFSSTSPTSCAGTSPSSSGSQNYFAFVCDDENECSSSKSGTFLVDATPPAILDFDVNPKKSDGLWVSALAPDVTIDWHVQDNDASDSGLQEVQAWRSGNGGADWEQILGSPFAAPSNDWIYSVDDSSAESGTYLYGIHAKDNVGNEITETQAGFSAIEVQVDKDEPTALIDAPVLSWLWSSAQQQSFLKTADEDLDSGINPNGCTFEVCSYEPDGTEHCKGTEQRACNIAANTQEIFVGPAASHCDYQGRNSCVIFVEATDQAGNTGSSFRSYNTDWEFPQPGKLYITATEGEQTYPIQVGNDTPVTYNVHVTDNLEINYCNLYIDGVLEQGPVLASGCTNDCVIEFEDVSLPAPGGNNIYANNYAVCYDSSSHAAQGAPVDIEIALSVGLSAIPSQGSINTLFDLSAQVTGTAQGLADFKFDCTDNGIWEYERDNIDLSVSDPGWIKRPGDGNTYTKVTAPDTFAVRDLCQYGSVDIYTAATQVSRGSSTATDTTTIQVSENGAPTAIPQTPIVNSYCEVTYAHITLPWQFSDPDPGDAQHFWQAQIATNQNFQPQFIVDDTGDSPPQAGASSEYAPASGILEFNDTYHWRVKVWDEFDESPWATGPSFATPVHAYPSPDFTWSPAFPSAEEEIQFTDQTLFAQGSAGKTWSWNFGDTGTSSSQNPKHAYEENGAYGATLTAGDDAGSCLQEKTVNVQLPFPEWQEISPF